jgi:hypothetical protein
MLTNFTRVARSLKVKKAKFDHKQFKKVKFSTMKKGQISKKIFPTSLANVGCVGLCNKKKQQILSVNSFLSIFFDFGQKAASI